MEDYREYGDWILTLNQAELREELARVASVRRRWEGLTETVPLAASVMVEQCGRYHQIILNELARRGCDGR